jgi:hypothetical protein
MKKLRDGFEEAQSIGNWRGEGMVDMILLAYIAERQMTGVNQRKWK